jgi:hypothetical protein
MIFSAITQAPGAPDPLAGLRDNAQVVEVPWPAWVWWAIGAGALVLAGLLVWFGIWLARRKAPVLVYTPREMALRDLEALRLQVDVLEPYAFSVVVSDVLRRFINAQYKLPATQQTSPEFLAELSSSHDFLTEDRELLATFLERCDLLKFARITGRADENQGLLQAATAFAQGAGK